MTADWRIPMSKKRISKEKSIRHAKTTTEIVISLVLLGSCGLFVKNAFTDITKVEQSPYFDNNDIGQDLMTQTTEPDPNQVIYESLSVETKNKFYGDLILINRDHEYFTSFNEDLVNIYDMNVENNCNCFSIVDTSYTILRQVYGPMSKMIQDFYDIYANDTLEIYGSYRAACNILFVKIIMFICKFKKIIYISSWLAFDFTETENYDYNGEGDFAWLNANCYKYGFIVRYTRSKESITKFRDEPWHFRYVGKPHAYYMDSHDLCLEEYIDLLRKYPYSGEHLEFSDDKNDYEIYFVAADDSSEKTSIPVPNGERYEISGNNVDGFIVTVYKGQKPIVEEVTTTEFEDVSGDLSGSENENDDSGDQSEDDYE